MSQAGPLAAPLPRVQRKVIGVLIAAQISGGAGVATGFAVAALVASGLAGSEAVGGLAASCSTLGSALLALPAARVAARYGRRPALLIGYGAGVVGAAVSALAVVLGAWPLLLAGLVLFGGASMAGLAGRYTATDLADPRYRARSLSIVVWAGTIGAVAGPNLAGPAGTVATALGMPAAAGAFLLSLLVFGIASASVAIGLRPDPLVLVRASRLPAVAGCCPAHDGAALVPRAKVATLWRRLGRPARLAMAGIALCHSAMVGLMSMTPVHLDHGGASLQVVGVVLSIHIAGMYAASPLFGWLADRIGRVPVLACGAALVVAAAAIAGTAPSHDAPQVAVGLTVLGLGWSAGVVSGSTLLTESVPVPDRPAVQGLSDLVMNAGGAVAGVVAGTVVTTTSFGVLSLLVGFAALPLLIMSLLTVLR